jgi:hypothetical protein
MLREPIAAHRCALIARLSLSSQGALHSNQVPGRCKTNVCARERERERKSARAIKRGTARLLIVLSQMRTRITIKPYPARANRDACMH